MAHGYLEKLQNGQAKIYSAGIQTHGLNADAVAIMREDGIDIAHHTSNLIDDYSAIAWDYIITVCDHAKENCPYISSPNAKRIHHNFLDPSKVVGTEQEKHTAFQKTRNEIREFCKDLLIREGLSQ